MAVNDRDLSALEYLAGRIREDVPGAKPWDREGTHIVFLRELKGRHLVTALEEVLHHAADPEAKTPGAIMRPFKPVVATPLPRGSRPPKGAEECSDHIGQLPPPYCAIHANDDVLAWYDTEEAPTVTPTDPKSAADAIRQRLRNVNQEAS